MKNYKNHKFGMEDGVEIVKLIEAEWRIYNICMCD